MQWLQDKYKKADVMVGIEPTSHYWFDLGAYLEDEGILLVMVNPYAVKQTKELDDKLRIDGILVTMVMPRTNISKEITATAKSAEGGI